MPAASTSPVKVAVPPPPPNGPWVAKCKGLPFSATIETVAQFFDGLAIADDGIRIRTNEQGVPKGECLVTFAAEGALTAALERTRQVMGHKFVTVQLADAAEVADAFPPAPSPVPSPSPAPTRAAAPALASARGSASPSKPLSAASANGGKGNGGKGGALQYISAATEAPPATAGAPAAAVTAVPGGKVGSSTSSKGGGKGGDTGGKGVGKGGDTGGKGVGGSHRAATAESNGAGANGSGSGDANGSGSGGASASATGGGSNIVIKMRGLPYSTTEQEIANFFPGIKIASGGVSIGRDASGRASGEAHVEFATDQDAQSAMLLNRQQMGSRYIELFRTRQPPNAVRKAVTSTAAEGTSGSSDSLRLRGMPFKSTEADVQTFFKGCVSSRVAPAHAFRQELHPPMARRAPPAHTHLSLARTSPRTHRYLHTRPGCFRCCCVGRGGEPQAPAYWQAAGPFFARLFFAGWCEIRGRPTALPAPCMRRRVIKPTISFARPLTSASPPRYSVASGGITLGPRVGQGTVRFASAEECRRALVNLNGHHMGNRYIELFFS